MNVQAVPAISDRVKVGVPLAVLAVALAFCRLSYAQTFLLTPLFLAVGGLLLIALGVAAADRQETRPDKPTIAARQRHALRRFNFTTSSAWSAVLTKKTWEESPSSTWRIPVRHLGTRAPATRLDLMFDLIKANFIVPWYARISPSRAFPDAVEILIRQCLSRTVQQGEQVDWADILISRMTPLLTAHLHHYRTIEHLSSTSPAPHSLPLPLPRMSHPALANTTHGNQSTTPNIESHLRVLVKRMLDRILPDYENTPVVGVIAVEVVLGTILMPAFEMLSDGDFWNRQIDERGGRYLHEQ
jgi:sorting nexin-25